MTCWVRGDGPGKEIWFSLEADTEGEIVRRVELQGPLQRPVAAASLAEGEAARQAGTLAAYEATFGVTAKVHVQGRDPHDPQDLSPAKFETV